MKDDEIKTYNEIIDELSLKLKEHHKTFSKYKDDLKSTYSEEQEEYEHDKKSLEQ